MGRGSDLGGLSDVLRQMAEEERQREQQSELTTVSDRPDQSASDQPTTISANDQDEVIEAELDIEAETQDIADAYPSPGSRPMARRKRSDPKSKRLASWLLCAAGVVFLLPAVWGLLLTLGWTTVMADRENAQNMATASLVLGTLFGGIMLAGAWFFRWQARIEENARAQQ